MDIMRDRLKAERERLGLSQEEFGLIGGVKKLAQLNYEKGKRSPTGEYFDCLRLNKNIDVHYILSGLRDNNESRHYQAEARVNTLIAMALDLDPVAFCDAIDEAFRQSEECDSGDGFPVKSLIAEKVDSSLLAVENSVYDAIDLSPRIFDSKIIEGVIVGLESLLLSAGFNMSPEKKASAVVMLYRIFKASGKVDQKVIEDVVSLSR